MTRTVEWLDSRIGLNFRPGLERMERAVAFFKQPQEQYPIIHVTGTNGKGSTIAFLSSLFQAHGKKVGTFTSPHIVKIQDRIAINGQPISDQDFERLASRLADLEESILGEDKFSYFEILCLLAFLYFAQEGVELALIEVGIGGLLDTTNVVTGELALISSVGLDHQETLGSSLAAIAEQKAGIFKPGKKALIGPLAEEAELVCQKRAEDLGIPLYQYGEDFSLIEGAFVSRDYMFDHLSLGLVGAHQEENAALALAAFCLFMEEREWPISASALRTALEQTRWAGRLEEVKPRIYLDGAHNLAALKRLVDFIQEQKVDQVEILFGALKRKDYQAMLTYLKQELPAARLTVTSFAYGEALEEADVAGLAYRPDYLAYIQDFQEKKEQTSLLFVTGSLYFISEVRQALLADGHS
ncbi:bifunctional folylpolyglutamate synthase/dihydrofolate synthase [Streptococcus oricebi]|uniref:Bifunctional folylpolyglutamate synthase/dihydrofolate synthase n=1 Tax=Streptococcus oricebi TaxID=1547447 RepID=A0ABS5B549_9STRE|nr:folylpolyglutamate synthase/dihydrofolate synthase family protein [Streptococcus oricebi]MBP2623939.1 bifunctional folylpolyglutamate synthase/dihydrofolate synthase [Streptococcus oricebi]